MAKMLDEKVVKTLNEMSTKDKAKISEVVIGIVDSNDTEAEVGKKVVEALKSAALWLG